MINLLANIKIKHFLSFCNYYKQRKVKGHNISSTLQHFIQGTRMELVNILFK